MSDFSWGTRYATWPQAVEMMRRVRRFRKEGFYLLVDEEEKQFKVTLMGPSLTKRAKIEKELADLELQRSQIEFVIGMLRHDLSTIPANKRLKSANKNRISN